MLVCTLACSAADRLNHRLTCARPHEGTAHQISRSTAAPAPGGMSPPACSLRQAAQRSRVAGTQHHDCPLGPVNLSSIRWANVKTRHTGGRGTRQEAREGRAVSVPRDGLQPVPDETARVARVARAAFPEGTVSLRLRDALGTLFDDDLFTTVSSIEGQPARSPSLATRPGQQPAVHGTSQRSASGARRACPQ